PQLDRWEERAFQDLSEAHEVSANLQLDAAMKAFPGAIFQSYRLPERSGDAAVIRLALRDGHSMQDVFVSPQGKVLGSLDPKYRIQKIVQDIHSQLLLGHRGSWLVELAASWAIVMIMTGLYLWWPAKEAGGMRGLAGVVWPRMGKGNSVFLRDLHAVTGFWVAGLAMILLLSGLPWTDVWGKAFKGVREEMGWVIGKQDWTIGGRAPDAAGEHGEHDHAAMMKAQSAGQAMTSLADVVARAEGEHLAFPVIITPPGTPQRMGAKADMTWTVRSDAQNRPLRATVKYDMATGKQLTRESFEDKHVIDQVIGYGVAWHEGHLFGWINQLIGLLTALMLITLAVSGFLMWRKRKPEGALGAPPFPRERRKGKLIPVILLLAAFLPMLAASLILMLLFDRLILPRIPTLANWLGCRPNLIMGHAD
ncbi:MAG: PepSY domain-containing protein, partial [Sphingomonadaceae bacterium]|nr:PepSY domain-containing protein [Sphingomonadaceae bacterium]